MMDSLKEGKPAKKNVVMMQSAWCETVGRKFIIGLDDLEGEIRPLSDKKALTCPNCKRTVVLKAGQVRAHHFAHLKVQNNLCVDEWYEPDGPEHQAMKLAVLAYLKEIFSDAIVEIEVPIPQTGQRADVLAVLTNGKRLAVEVQVSPLSGAEWQRRHDLYREAGIEDLWLVGFSRYKFKQSQREPDLDLEEGYTANRIRLFHLPDLEKTLGLVSHRVYYLDVLTDKATPRLITLCQFNEFWATQYEFPFKPQVVYPQFFIKGPRLVTPYDKLARQKQMEKKQEEERKKERLRKLKENFEPYFEKAIKRREENLAGFRRASLLTPQWRELKSRFRLQEKDLEMWEVNLPGWYIIKCDPRIWLCYLYYYTVKAKYKPGENVVWPWRLARWFLFEKFGDYLDITGKREGQLEPEYVLPVLAGFRKFLILLGIFSPGARDIENFNFETDKTEILALVSQGFPDFETIEQVKRRLEKEEIQQYRSYLRRVYFGSPVSAK